MEILGNVQSTLPELHRWVRQQPVSGLIQSRYARGRLEAYYGLGVTLSRQPNLYRAIDDERVNALGDRILSGWHSALLCKYLPGVCIHPHRDHTCFERWAVMVNIGEAIFVEYPEKERITTPLRDGDVVRINTKILHGVEPVTAARYSLTFRTIKPEFLTPSLELGEMEYGSKSV